MTVYSADICIDCRNFKHLAAQRGLNWTLVDITESTANLRAFLHLRDTHPAFDLCREKGGIGIPCFTEGDFLTLDLDEALAREGLSPALESELPERR